MQLKPLLAALLTLVAAGRTARAEVPSWCKVDGKIETGSMQSLLDPDASDQARGVAYLLCNPDQQDPGDAPKIAAAKQQLNARLGLTDADWADVAFYLTDRRRPFQHASSKTPWSTLDPIDQFAAITDPEIAIPGHVSTTDPSYITDAFGTKLSQAGRVAYAVHCLRATAEPVEWAMCQGDFDALDVRALAAELHADKVHTGFERMSIRIAMDEVRAQLPARAAAIKALVAKDPAYGKLFEIAAATRTAWVGRSKELSDVLAVVAAADDAMVSGSRKLAQGCEDRALAAFAAAIAKLPAKSVGAAPALDPDHWYANNGSGTVVFAMLADPRGYLAAEALGECPAGAGARSAIRGAFAPFRSALARWPGHRGPRTSIETAIVTASIELDDRNAHLDFPDVDRFWFSGGSGGLGLVGRVATVKVSGDRATITFVKKSERVSMTTGCHETNRIRAINDGKLIYDYVCTGSEMVTVKQGPPDADVAAATVKGIKPGMVIAVDDGLVWAGWGTATSTAPSFVLGVPVK